jgi:hypothetical protein
VFVAQIKTPAPADIRPHHFIGIKKKSFLFSSVTRSPVVSSTITLPALRKKYKSVIQIIPPAIIKRSQAAKHAYSNIGCRPKYLWQNLPSG